MGRDYFSKFKIMEEWNPKVAGSTKLEKDQTIGDKIM